MEWWPKWLLGGRRNNRRSSQLPLEQYDSDKIAGRYLERYDPILEPWLKKRMVLLELGVHQGGSLLLWRDYFPHGTIVGIDISLPKEFKPTKRIHIYEGSQADPKFLSRVANETAPDGFDIIIDDAFVLFVNAFFKEFKITKPESQKTGIDTI